MTPMQKGSRICKLSTYNTAISSQSGEKDIEVLGPYGINTKNKQINKLIWYFLLSLMNFPSCSLTFRHLIQMFWWILFLLCNFTVGAT